MVDAYRRGGGDEVQRDGAEASTGGRASSRRSMRVPKGARGATVGEPTTASGQADAASFWGTSTREVEVDGTAPFGDAAYAPDLGRVARGSGEVFGDDSDEHGFEEDSFGTASGIHVKAAQVPSLAGLLPVEAPHTVDWDDVESVRGAIVRELTFMARSSVHQDAVNGEGSLERLLSRAEATQDPLHAGLESLAREVRRLRLLADTDPMTGVANRRVFCDAVARELSRQRRDGGPVSVAVLDLDGLKQLNDTRGHGVGDRAIRALAESCQGAVRGADLVGRLGGDEFALLLCGIDARRAQRVVRRIKEALADRRAGGEPVSASVGVASAMAGEFTVGQLLRAADEALYQDKSARAGHRMSRPGIKPVA